MPKSQKFNARQITAVNFIIVAYFLFLYLSNYFRFEEYVSLIGLFRELLTIPFLAGQLIFIVLSIRFFINERPPVLTVISFILLIICTILTIGSFFV